MCKLFFLLWYGTYSSTQDCHIHTRLPRMQHTASARALCIQRVRTYAMSRVRGRRWRLRDVQCAYNICEDLWEHRLANLRHLLAWNSRQARGIPQLWSFGLRCVLPWALLESARSFEVPSVLSILSHGNWSGPDNARRWNNSWWNLSFEIAICRNCSN